MGVFDPNAGKALMFLNYMANGNFRNKRRAGRAFNKMWDADEANRKQAWVSNLMSNPEPVMDAPNLMTDDEVMNKMNNKSLSLVDTSFRIPKNTVKTGTDWNAAALAMGDGKTMDDVRKFQQEAKAHGIDTGGVDGKFGNRTRQAWEAYKKNNNSWNTPDQSTMYDSSSFSLTSTPKVDVNGNPVSNIDAAPFKVSLSSTPANKPAAVNKPVYAPGFKRWFYSGKLITPGTVFKQNNGDYLQYNTDGTSTTFNADDPNLVNKLNYKPVQAVDVSPYIKGMRSSPIEEPGGYNMLLNLAYLEYLRNIHPNQNNYTVNRNSDDFKNFSNAMRNYFNVNKGW